MEMGVNPIPAQLGPRGQNWGQKWKKPVFPFCPILSRMGELLNTLRNVHFFRGGPGAPPGPRNRGSREAPKWAPESGSAQGPQGTLGYGPPPGASRTPRDIPPDRHPSTGPSGYKLSSSRTPYSAYHSRRWVSVVSRDLEFELRVMGDRYVVGESASGYGVKPWRLLPQSAIRLGAGSHR